MTTIQVPDNSGSFLIGSIQLYEQMLHDLMLCQRKEREKLAEIQCCFEMAASYANRICSDVRDYPFASQSDEIFFFKEIKPLFTGEVEFCTYLYHMEIFKSTVEVNSRTELQLFFERQLQRRSKFSRENAAFYSYMETGGTELDTSWFIRLPDNPSCCDYDKQLASYLAIGKYEHFIRDELRALGGDISKPENEE